MSERQVSPAEELFWLTLTASRLLLAGRMAKKVDDGKGIAGEMLAFVVADVADGVLTRRFSAETPRRRFVDALTDRLSVAWVATKVGRKNKVAKPYIAALAAREALVATASGVHFLRHGEVVQGTGIHKLGTLSMATFGVVAATENKAATHLTGMLSVGINALLAVNYVMNAVRPIGNVDDIGVRQITFK